MLSVSDYVAHDGVGLAELVARKEVCPEEPAQAGLAVAERLNPLINAIVEGGEPDVAGQLAQASPSAPLFGVPVLVKDLLSYPGFSTAYGSRMFSAMRLAQPASPYALALKNAGVVVLGKATTSELGLAGTTEPLLSGQTRNPWDLEKSTGGSSGGSVAAVAAGIVPVAHASDGGGSVRGPASFCGLFGFKPSRDATLQADVPSSMPTASLLSEHCVSRSVRDSAEWLRLTWSDRHETDLPHWRVLAERKGPRLRIGYYLQDAFGRMPNEDALKTVESTIKLCQELGHELREVKGPQFDAEATAEAFFGLTGTSLQQMLAGLRSHLGSAFPAHLIEPLTLELASRYASWDEARIGKASGVLDAAKVRISDALSGVDVLLCPTVAYTAFALGRFDPSQQPATIIAHIKEVAAYTVPASIAGWTSMSVPLYWTPDGLPIGSHFAAAKGADEMLLGLAFELERARPWGRRLNECQRELQWRSGSRTKSGSESSVQPASAFLETAT